MIEYWEVSKLYICGTIGAMFTAWFNRKTIGGIMDIIIFIVFGGVISHFITPLTITMVDVDVSHLSSLGFLHGVFGGFIFQKLWATIKEAQLWEFIKTRFGKKED